MPHHSTTLAPAVAHLWALDPATLERAGALAGFAASLSVTERARMVGLRSEPDRLAFLAAHGLARAALSWCAPSVPPSAWELRPSANGRPEVAAPLVVPGLRFNLSHTGGLVACVVTVEADCGVDVEALGRRGDLGDLGALAGRFLSPSERASLAALAPEDRPERFFRYWTLKEAYVKARGLGMSLPMERCAFELDGGRIRASIDPSLGDDGSGWRFAQWPVGSGHLLAVAVRHRHGAAPLIVRHRLPPRLKAGPPPAAPGPPGSTPPARAAGP